LDIDRAALLQLFLSDSEEDLARLETQVLTLEDRPNDAEGVAEIFRIAHTLKGNAAILGLEGFARVAHALEDVLHVVRARQRPVSGELVTLVLGTVDALRGMLTGLRAGGSDDPTAHKPLRGELAAFVAGAGQGTAAPAGSEGEEGEGAAVGPTDDTPMPTIDGNISMGPALRIEMAKVDQLLDLAARALVVQGQMGAALLEAAEPDADLLELHQKNERLLMELQDWIIEARMIPVAAFFRSHARAIRDAARAQRKRARLRIEGERVRVDTGIGENARDVLTHLVRNAIDHGIEPPAARAAQGKNPEGTIVLRAAQNGNQVVIQVADDGAGFNLAKIRDRARQLGRANADSLSKEELHQLVFEPGFSTTEKVTALSGRGVGMDVVRRCVEDLHGTVDVESVEGQGTTVELRLPLSLSVIEGFWVGVAGTDYVLPLDDVVECLEMPDGMVGQGHGAGAGGGGIVDLRGEPLAFVHLGDVLDAGRASRPVRQIVVVRHRAARVGLGVDAIRGERQTVIKPLGRLFRTVAGISGSTMRPDGTVAFVIDVARLLRSAARQGVAPGLSEAQGGLQ
jgi:two-component system chemotaxis sensor kinase CheA